MIQPEQSDSRVILLCRNPSRRAVLQQLVPGAQVHAWPVEVALAVARGPARAVVVNIEDVLGSQDDVLAALQRARPGLAVYAIVAPAEEPLGRQMCRQGAADYFVMPWDIRRLPGVLSAPPSPAAPAAAAT